MSETEKLADIPRIQWYPGHMKKARQEIEKNLKSVDVVAELLDARIPMSSANPMLKEIIGRKPRTVVLNKSDLADDGETKKWLKKFAEQNIVAVALDSLKGTGQKKFLSAILNLARPQTEKFAKHGAKPRPARVMIIGIPNVGKSSLINRLAKAAKTSVENRPGVTRAKQWIKIGDGVDLLDTPGILWPKFDDKEAALKLACTGAVRDEIYDMENAAIMLLKILRQTARYEEYIKKRFKTDELPADDRLLLEAIGKKRGCLVKGGAVDTETTARIFLSEYRKGLLGKITLDFADGAESS